MKPDAGRKIRYTLPILIIALLLLLSVAQGEGPPKEEPDTIRLSGHVTAEMGKEKSGKLELKGQGRHSLSTSMALQDHDLHVESIHLSLKGETGSLDLGRMPMRLPHMGNRFMDGMDLKWENGRWEYRVLSGTLEGKKLLGAGLRTNFYRGGELAGTFLLGDAPHIGVSLKTPISENLWGGANYTLNSGHTLWATLRRDDKVVRASYMKRQELEKFHTSLSFRGGRGNLVWTYTKGDGHIDRSGKVNIRAPLKRGANLYMDIPLHSSGVRPSDLRLGLSVPLNKGSLTLKYSGDGDVKMRLGQRLGDNWTASLESSMAGIKVSTSYKGEGGRFWQGSLDLSDKGMAASMELGQGPGSILMTMGQDVYAGVRFTKEFSCIYEPQGLGGEVTGQITYEDGKAASGLRLTLEGHGHVLTDGEGRYSFENVKEGRYLLSMGEEGVSARFGPVGGWIREIEVSSGERVDVDIAMVPLASVEGRIFIDTNGNFAWDPGEDVLEPVMVTLEPLGKRSISSGGVYRFSGLFPGVYRIRIDEENLGDGYRLRSIPERGVALAPGENAKDIDFILEKVRRPTLKRIF